MVVVGRVVAVGDAPDRPRKDARGDQARGDEPDERAESRVGRGGALLTRQGAHRVDILGTEDISKDAPDHSEEEVDAQHRAAAGARELTGRGGGRGVERADPKDAEEEEDEQLGVGLGISQRTHADRGGCEPERPGEAGIELVVDPRDQGLHASRCGGAEAE